MATPSNNDGNAEMATIDYSILECAVPSTSHTSPSHVWTVEDSHTLWNEDDEEDIDDDDDVCMDEGVTMEKVDAHGLDGMMVQGDFPSRPHP